MQSGRSRAPPGSTAPSNSTAPAGRTTTTRGRRRRRRRRWGEIELLISDTPLPLQEADEQPEGMIDLTIHTTAGAAAPPLEEKSAAQAVAELLALGAGRLSCNS